MSNVREKIELQDCLKKAIVLNVPVALGNEEPRHKSMAWLDVTARWELLAQDKVPVPKPENEDQQHRQPTKVVLLSTKNTATRKSLTGCRLRGLPRRCATLDLRVPC